MTVGEKLAQSGMLNDELLRLFKAAQKDLIAIVRDADTSQGYARYRADQARAIDAVILRLTRDTARISRRDIPKVFRAGVEEAHEKIKSFDEQEFAIAFSGVNEEAVKVLADDAALEFGNTIVGLRQDATRALMNKRKIADEIVQSVIQGSSVARTERQVVDILRSDGLSVLKTRNGFGRRMRLEPYANMLVRTQTMTAYNQGGAHVMLETGRRYAIFPTIRPDIDGEDICNEWERKKYIDLLTDPLPPQSTHPNCRHHPQPVSFEQLKAERPDLYDKAIAYFRQKAG